MRAVLVACLAFCFCTSSASAADRKVEAALKEFKAVGADPARLKIFCAMSKAVDAVDEKDDPAAEEAIEGYLKELGLEFEKAWYVGEDLEESSTDAKALAAAIDELVGMCD